jgi:hypothetical protein
MFNLYDIDGGESDYYIQPIKNNYLIVKKVKNTVINGEYIYIIIQCVPIHCMSDIINIVICGQQYYINYDIFDNIKDHIMHNK